ncbi:MAG: DUF3568 family protein [Candidatus Dadabacteria bacterium]|nr:DUF3568 family protein [Candidatus Dadabacteria bacterium]
MNFLPKKYHAVLLCLLAFVFSSGCVLVMGGAVGGGTAAYLRGVLKSKETTSFDNVWFAVVEVVEQQEFEVTKKESNVGKALIEAKLRVQAKMIYMTVKYDKPEITDLIIRVGIWGDEEESRRILKLIHEKLY